MALAKSITRSFLFKPVTAPALLPVKSPLSKVIVRSAISAALVCAVAVPVKLIVTTVEEVLVKTAVNPSGTFVTSPVKSGSATNVSPVRVIVAVAVIEPSFAAASAKVVAL